MADLAVGDRIEYILPPSPAHNRPTTRYLPGQIIKITTKRVVIRLDGYLTHRVTIAKNVRRLQGPVAK